MNWDDYFMNMVYLVAMKSKDVRTHIGAVIVGPKNEVRSTGYNSFPHGINDNIPERQVKPEKFKWFAHAERNSIYNAARVGIPLDGCTMYTNGTPCYDCAIAIINSGIIRVIIDNEYDDNRYLESMQMFNEANVVINRWSGELVGLMKFKDGKIL